MVNSKKKGSRVELETVNFLKSYNIQARRTAQYCGNTGDASDIVVEPPHVLSNWHKEVKGTAKAIIPNCLYSEWLKQVQNDSGNKPWVIFHKANNRPLGAIISAIAPINIDIIPSASLIDFPKELTTRKEERRILEVVWGNKLNSYLPAYAFVVDNTYCLFYFLASDFIQLIER